MKDMIIIAILLVLVSGIVWYLWKEKKQGAKCIGCPYAKQCSQKANGSCSGKTTDHTQNKHH